MIQEKNISGQREKESGINIILGGKKYMGSATKS
jgi:hypothetical protein